MSTTCYHYLFGLLYICNFTSFVVKLYIRTFHAFLTSNYLIRTEYSLQELQHNGWMKWVGPDKICFIKLGLLNSWSASAKRIMSSSDKICLNNIHIKARTSQALVDFQTWAERASVMLRPLPLREAFWSKWLCMSSKTRWYMRCSMGPEKLTRKARNEDFLWDKYSIKCFKAT